jgi:two-component system nitrogen regulation sensor histidine kinase NtrY
MKSEIIHISLRVVLLFALIFGAILLFQHQLYYSFALFFLLILIAIVEFIHFIYQYLTQVNRIISALRYHDYSLQLKKTSNETVNNAVELYAKIKEENAHQVPLKLIYNQILDSLESGVVIIKVIDDQKEVMFMNDYMCHFLDIPKTKSWNMLYQRADSFCKLLESRSFSDFKTSIDIQVDNKERQTFLVQASCTHIHRQKYYIVLMDSIQRMMESKENEAWGNIMKVISHELMNSLAPIHSLAYSMKEIIQKDDLDPEDQEDFRLSIDTIINRSNHLQKFVDRYRKLTMLPTPQFSKESIHDIIHGVIQNYQYLFREKGIIIHLNLIEDCLLDLDKIQFEQVIINLLTNSIYAVDELEEKEINISTAVEGKRFYIHFSDSGKLIDKDIVTKIFLPFYTTRKEGAGIGLALSKSIIEAHNSYLYYKEVADKNTFVISMIIP